MTDRRDILRGLAVTTAGLLLPARLTGSARSIVEVDADEIRRVQSMGGQVTIRDKFIVFEGCVFNQPLTLHAGDGNMIQSCTFNVQGAPGLVFHTPGRDRHAPQSLYYAPANA